MNAGKAKQTRSLPDGPISSFSATNPQGRHDTTFQGAFDCQRK